MEGGFLVSEKNSWKQPDPGRKHREEILLTAAVRDPVRNKPFSR